MEDQGARVAAGAASTSAPDDGIPASSAGPAIDVVGLAEKTSLMQRRICCGRMTVSTAIKLALLLALVLGIVLGLTVGNLDEKIGDLFEWVDENRAPGIFIFFGVYSLCTGAQRTVATDRRPCPELTSAALTLAYASCRTPQLRATPACTRRGALPHTPRI